MPVQPPPRAPADVLAILDELMGLPGAQVHHYAVVRRMLDDGLPLEAYSLGQLQVLTGKSTTTCKSIRRWIAARITVGELALSEGQNPDPGQDSDPCMVPSSETDVQPVPPNHGAESRPEAESRLSLQKLLEIDWGQKDGRQVQDPEALVRTHGPAAVLAALDRANGGDVRDPAAFVTWCLQRQLGHQESEEIARVPRPAIVRAPEDPEPTAVETTPLPDTPPELRPLLDWLRDRVRPQTWNSWFATCRLMPGTDDGAVRFWMDNPYAADWVRDHFGALLRQGVQEALGTGVRLEFGVHDDAEVSQ